MFKPGSIRKIQVQNFVTYSYTELYPGPQLNMIIGPNGTGKSTMVAAVILGLGGNPKIVGRGSKVSEYVKHDCEEATINIYLQGDTENEFIKVTRQFNIHEKSVWKLNGKKVVLNDVLDFIKKYSIQVNNLCQFLPQDRVQDFAKLNKQDLLRETQRALCRDDLIEKQDLLVTSRERHKTLLANLESFEQKLQEAKDANVRLEGRVQNFNKKKKYLEQIRHIDRKLAWVAYDEMHGKVMEAKEDKVRAAQLYEKYKSAAKPMEKDIQSARNLVKELQQNNSKITQAIRTTEQGLNENLENVETIHNSVRRINNDTNSKLAELEQREKEIDLSVTKLEEMKNLHKEMVAKLGAENETKNQLTVEINKLTGLSRGLEDRREEVTQSKQTGIAQLRALENEITRLENVKHHRLQKLQRIDEDAYNAVVWLRNNKHLFKDEIYEPIMLELNVLDPKNGVYLENVIPMRDRLAFTCVSKDDMNLLMRILREQKGLTINVLHSGRTGESLNQFQPSIPIEQLKKYGLYTYLHSLFTAPEPIMRYLLKTYRMHNIPIGNHNTNKFYEQIPQQIRSFFSDKYRFTINVSRYSGEKSSRQVEIGPDGTMSISVDVIKMENLKGQTDELRRNYKVYDTEIEKFNKQIDQMNEKVKMLRDQLTNINQQKQNVRTIDHRIRAMQGKIEDMRSNRVSPENIKAASQQKIQKLVQSIQQVQEVIKRSFKKISALLTQSSLYTIKIENARKRVAFLENQFNDTRQQCQEAEATLTRIKEHYSNLVTEAKAILNKAKNLSNGCTPDEDGFKEFKHMFDSLTSDVQKLEIDKEQLTSRIDCLNTADDGELREYDERLKLIERLQNDIERGKLELTKLTQKMEKMESDWLTPLNRLVTEINQKFSSAFERMGCAGEVSICAGDNVKDYSKYGISIKVTYRNHEPLQELNTTVQSGGERAVATAAFMLSLQELTPVPFRCVDEINQGMDANNERRIFELLLDSTSQPNTAQYFLITPKLVPHLKFSRAMMIHIVHNGPFVKQDCKWAFSKLCNPQNVHI